MSEAIAWLKLIAVLILMCIIAPKLAWAGAKGLISGAWKSWNTKMLDILES